MVPTVTRGRPNKEKRPHFFFHFSSVSGLFSSPHFYLSCCSLVTAVLPLMDFCLISGDNHHGSQLDQLFSTQNTEEEEEEEVSLEWLSLFVEDCLTSTGNNLALTTTKEAPKGTEPLGLENQIDVQRQRSAAPTLEKFVVPSKARSKRKRVATIPKSQTNPLFIWSQNLNPNGQNLNFGSSGYLDPPLLSQGTWLADSELIIPKGEEKSGNVGVKREAKEEVLKSKEGLEQQGQGRRCSHCQTQRTPQWRAGPLGPKTLCNACGVRYKSGRLLPEYRPAKSPSFVTHLHSNSHRKVLEMRKGLLS